MSSPLLEALATMPWFLLLGWPLAGVLWWWVRRRDCAPARRPIAVDAPVGDQVASDQTEQPAALADSIPPPAIEASEPEPPAPPAPPAPRIIAAAAIEAARSTAVPALVHQRPVAPVVVDGDPPAAPAGVALLLVDDSAVARAKLRRLFESAGYTVTLARDGLDALERLAAGRYALMITDLEMPNMDGAALIAAVSARREDEHMPILAITGHEALQSRLTECQRLCGIFRKPWDDTDLLRSVETLVQAQRRVAVPLALH